jgi:hypothetical protein
MQATNLAVCSVLALLSSSMVSLSIAADDDTIRFNRDIRPILTDKCFACHGPDAETVEGGLRLDLAEEAKGIAGAIVPGDPAASEVIRRIFSDDNEERMPPPHLHKPLSDAERNRLRRWVAQGAEYEPHWAYTPLRRSADKDTIWQSPDPASNLIDRLVDARLRIENVTNVPEADRITLIRRLSFDLTGVPPALSEVDAFLSDSSVDAYPKLVDRLLDSPRFGERMAIYWLDLVRYADTVGYHGDQNVSQAPYRDYVINAFNDNMPYDRFVREQLAGDLLSDATIDQQVASGYNRLNQTTEEGGAQAREYLSIYFADRVRNVSQVFMGATMGCAQCHDHKFDPYTSRDFYAFGAFFADIEEKGVYGERKRDPMIRVYNEEQGAQWSAVDQRITKLKTNLDQAKLALLNQPDWETNLRNQLPDSGETETILSDGDEAPTELVEALAIARDQRTDVQTKILQDFYLSRSEPIIALKTKLTNLETERTRIEESAPLTVVSKSVKPRTIRIQHRGNWMDDSGEIVSPAIPAFLGKLDTGEKRATRLDLANWLCQPDNPLTSRTMTNRLWRLMFGRGICTSVDDLGGQGTYPSYPDLLDRLSVEFIDSGWDIKHILREIANSETYRRSSKPTPALLETDPYNDLFARQGRFRVSAEMVRDSALAISGLLVEQIGGPSVHPYQPEQYYDQLNFPKRVYEADDGVNQYRRGVYTHWQRTFLHPMLKAFDAPSREECTAARSRSNTPLQALTLLNDPTFVEAARVFAARVMRDGGTTVADRLNWAYRTAVSSKPPVLVVDELKELYERHLRHFQANVVEANKLISHGNSPIADDLDPAELAAWTSVARVVLNLHETMTRN